MSSFSVGHWLIVGIVLWIIYRVLSFGGRVSKASPVTSKNSSGDVTCDQEIVGESFYADAFHALLGDRAGTEDEVQCKALVALDDKNEHDDQAVRISIDRRQVGHLSRDDARKFRAAMKRTSNPDARQWLVPAVIYAGGEEEVFSVRISLAAIMPKHR